MPQTPQALSSRTGDKMTRRHEPSKWARLQAVRLMSEAQPAPAGTQQAKPDASSRRLSPTQPPHRASLHRQIALPMNSACS
jgi:hypothetical protein